MARRPQRKVAPAEEAPEGKPKVMTFADFYIALQRWEGVPVRSLIGPWTPACRDSIAAALSAAFDEAKMRGATIPGVAGSTPPSAGNKAAAYLKDRLGVVEGAVKIVDPRDAGPSYRLEVIQGAGYPDFILRWCTGWCCVEVKSTSRDSSHVSTLRVVLTGSTRRLRAELDRLGSEAPAPCHLLFTLQHDAAGVVKGMRLDFLEPSTEVSVKLEASTSQRRLAEGGQTFYQYS